MSQFIGIRPPPGGIKRTFDFSVTTFGVGGNTFLFPHNMGTTEVIVQCFTSDGIQIQPASIEIVDDNNVRITFSGTQTGRCIIIS